jgi:hypothetical protein
MEVYLLQLELDQRRGRIGSFPKGDFSDNPNHFRLLQGEVQGSQTILLLLVGSAKITAVPMN